jgi:FKBP-type peptidyl-prolyl cis-trans isomerase
MILLPAALAILATGCLKNEWEEKENQEKEIIQEYLTAHNISEDAKTEGGIYFLEKKAGTGATPAKDDFVIINFVGRYLSDESIHETSYDSLKDEWAYSSVYKEYVYGPLKFQFGYSINGINEGLSLMKEGGRATLIIPSDMAFYDYKPLLYDIELLKVIPEPDTYEDSILTVYLAEKGYDSTNFYNNIWYKETLTPDPNDERTIEQGDTVYFRFSGRLVDSYGATLKDDRVFDNNLTDTKPVKFLYKSALLNSGILAMPTGLINALDSMRAGTHATVVLPYKQAFGETGFYSTVYGYTIVPKYQTVVYDVVIEAIKPPSK